MSVLSRQKLFREKFSLIGKPFSWWKNWQKEQARPLYRLAEKSQMDIDPQPYAIDMYPLLDLPFGVLDERGVLYNTATENRPATYHPSSIAQYALAQWNAYLKNKESKRKDIFMMQAHWLLEHEVRLSDEVGVWPIPFALPAYHVSQPWLSALTQGNIISVFVRAYQLTDDERFLQAAQRAVRTFEMDILDGGVRAPVGEDGIFFEEVAVYPAAHILNGYILAVLGLYDYVSLTHETKIEVLIQRSVETLHKLLEEFDTGYWTRYDLFHRHLAPVFYHSLHIVLLQALANYSGCEHCAQVAARWESYQHRISCRLRYLLTSRAASWSNGKLKPWLRRLFFRPTSVPVEETSVERVCVPITAFPVAGGMRGVLTNVARVMGDQWQMTYLTHRKGQEAGDLDIEIFGPKNRAPNQFPNIWLYSLFGGWKLFLLLRKRPNYTFLLPQDGAFTGAFTALVGRMAGIRVICMDHGNVTWLANPVYRREQMNNLHTRTWPRKLLDHARYALYWPSLHSLIRFSARYTDQFLVAGDEVADVYVQRLGVPARKISRYAYTVDPCRFTPPDRATVVEMREKQGISADAIVITLINRLTPEKGLPFAMEGVAIALASLAPEARSRVRVLIAGSGPLRSQLEDDIQRYRMKDTCVLWGEARPDDVALLLGISDIFLYTGIRGTNYSMAILEAMAASCAVVASTAPQSNATLLADGRGIAIRPGDATEVGVSLARLCNDLVLCQQMGQKARDYVLANHTATMLQRNLLRVTHFIPPLDTTATK